MRHFVVMGICLTFFLCGCASNPVKGGADTEAEIRLQRNMTPQEVVQLMGSPKRPVLIYFYLTENNGTIRKGLSKDKYTPLVFVNNKLSGWGWNYLNNTARDIMDN